MYVCHGKETRRGEERGRPGEEGGGIVSSLDWQVTDGWLTI
jgi:hypothetical protein